MLRDEVTNDNTASDVWADTIYPSQANEHWLRRNGKAMLERTAKANAAKSKVRARVEHVFVHQKDKMGLLIRTIGIKRAEAKVTLANLASTMHRHVFNERRPAMGYVCLQNRKTAEGRPRNSQISPQTGKTSA